MIWKKDRVYIVAEAGVNHNGDMRLARQLVDAAVEAEADAIKFQSYITEELVCRRTQVAEYQRKGSNSVDDQFEMLKNYELDFDAQREICHYCEKKGIQFLSSAFDLISLKFLIGELRLPLLKIPRDQQRQLQ
jgi:sialic acid synthase SpsE